MQAGAVDFLTKPIDDMRLFAAVDQAIKLDVAARGERAIREMIQSRFQAPPPCSTSSVWSKLPKRVALIAATPTNAAARRAFLRAVLHRVHFRTSVSQNPPHLKG